MNLHERLRNAALVVAHPDDEILWFSAIVHAVRRVFICYLDVPEQNAWSQGRRAAMARFPLPNAEFVGLTESVAFQQADWSNPLVASDGLVLNAPPHQRALPGFSAKRYADNFLTLQSYLRDALQGFPLVFTHNPWGEYGHEEHVQVHQAVASLRDSLGFEVWFDNYASDRSATLMARTLTQAQLTYETLPTRADAVAGIEALYREHGCWTWPFDDYRWFATESFVALPLSAGPGRPGRVAGTTLPINYINVDNAMRQYPPQVRPSLLRRGVRRLRRLLP